MDPNPYASPQTEPKPQQRAEPAMRFSLVRVAIALATLFVTMMVIGIVHRILMWFIID
jgi:hypothetical protein